MCDVTFILSKKNSPSMATKNLLKELFYSSKNREYDILFLPMDKSSN